MTPRDKLLATGIVLILVAFIGFVFVCNVDAETLAFFNVPANTPQETIVDEFKDVFPGIDIPKRGIMPSSTTSQGRHIVVCVVKQSYEDMLTLLDASGKNWQVWGARSTTCIPAHCSNPEYTNQEECELALETWMPSAPEVFVLANKSIKNFLHPRPLYNELGEVIGELSPENSWTPTFQTECMSHIFEED